MRIRIDRNWDLGVKAMKFRAVVVGFLLTMSLAAPIAMGATLPTLSAQVNTFPMVNEKCTKAGQWTGFADSRYASLKTWKQIDKSDVFSGKPGSFFGIFVCKSVNSKLLWQQYAKTESAYAKGGVYSATSPFMARLLEQRSVAYPGTGKICEVTSCPLGSTGPGGGIVFYDAGSRQPWGRYLEVAQAGWPGSQSDLTDPMSFWCDNLAPKDFGSVSDIGAPVGPDNLAKTIGTGKTLTSRMLNRCAAGAASAATSYRGGGTTDWFLPSSGEINELCKFAFGQLKTPTYILCDHQGNPRLGLKAVYWTSQQVIPKFPVIGIAVYEPSKLGVRWEQPFTATAGVDAYAFIRPIRAFTSPSDPLQKGGIIQLAGAGNPQWRAKCPAVVDKVGGTQPQVSGFFFDGTGETFVRLDNNSGNQVKSANNLVGCYANLTELNYDGGNGYHIGSINRDGRGYYWVNAQGITFGLTLSGMVMTTDKANPYYSEGRQFILKP
jgi:hypothetical protein